VLTIHTFVPYSQFFCLLKSIANICTSRSLGFPSHAEMHASLCLPKLTFLYIGHTQNPVKRMLFFFFCQPVQDILPCHLRDFRNVLPISDNNNGQLATVVFLDYVNVMCPPSAGTPYFFLIVTLSFPNHFLLSQRLQDATQKKAD
jgi:hypothetical protein